METLFWACLLGGAMFAIVTVLFGDLVSQALDGMLDFLSVKGGWMFRPMVIVSGITAFGGAGLLLLRYTPLGNILAALLAILSSVAVAFAVFVLYVRPMENSENSVAFSIRDLSGKIGEVTVSIPPRGYGEVLVKAGAGNTNQIAASFDGEFIENGARVVVVEVRDDTLYVSKLPETALEENHLKSKGEIE